MKRLINFLMRRRMFGAGIFLILTLILGYQVVNVTLNADFSTYLQQDDPVVQMFNLIGEEYASKSMALVLVEADDVFSAQTLKLVRDLTDAYEELDGIAYVTSLTNVLDFKKTEMGLEVGRLIRKGVVPEDREVLRRLKEYVLSKEMYVKDLVSKDGRSTVIVTRLAHGVDEYAVTKKIKKVTKTVAPSFEQISYGGMPFLMHSMTLIILENIKYLNPLMLILMIGVLFVGFRKAGGVFLPLLVVAFSIIWTVGLMTLFNVPFTMLTGIMPVILIAMGSADGIHVMRRYYEKRKYGEATNNAIKESFSELGMPIFITTVSSMIGFVSLLFTDFSVIRQFGFITALGIFIAMVVTFLLIPILLSFAGSKELKAKKPESLTEPMFMQHLARLVFNHKLKVLFLSGLIVITAGTVIPKIKKDVDWSLCLKKGSKAHYAEMHLRREFGGTLPIQTLVKGDLKDPSTLKAMRYLERYLETVASVGQTQSIAGVISEMNAVMNDRYVVPEARDAVANLLFLIEGEEIVEQLVKADSSEGLIQAKLSTWDTGIMTEAVGKIDQFINALPEKIMVININDVSPEIRAALLNIRSERVTDNLIRDISAKNVGVDKEELNAIVETAVFDGSLKDDVYIIVQRKVLDYLLGEDTEIEFIPQVSATTIADAVTEEVKRNPDVQLSKILAIAKSNIPQALKEDLNQLAQSLAAVVKEVVQERRVAFAFERIKAILPPGSGRIQDLFRNLKGDLWEINEGVIALGAAEYKGLPGVPDRSISKEIPISFENTGLAAVLKRMEEKLIPSQIMSLLIALVLIAIIIGFIFRSATIGWISIVPISLTILVNFAVMGYFKIGLDSFTTMVASVAIGLGIDTDIHFISCFKREFSKMGDELKALQKTLSTTGVAILINTLTVGIGFAVLLLSGGQHVRRFGGLVALTVFLSALFSFTVLPATLLLVKPKFLKRR